ncbi:MAG: NADH-quinone oxidoreductase subunit D [Pseudomonadota bacterium]
MEQYPFVASWKQPKDGLMVLNMGPHHPATHGVLNFLVETDGEVISRAVPEVGYLHRAMEGIAEKVGYLGFMPYTDRIDYCAAMFPNQGWAMAVENLLGIEVPRRAQYLRTIATELTRIASHFIAAGSMAMDIGAYTPFLMLIRERETFNDIMEYICGARLTYNYVWVGGVSRDFYPGLDRSILSWLYHLEPIIDEFDRLISFNPIYIDRLAGVAPISRQDAIGYALVGPNLRASGVDFDLRRDVPYSAYPELQFKVPVGKGPHGIEGDCYARFYARVEEIRESIKIVRQCIEGLPEGDVRAKVPKKLKPAVGETYARVESARGEMGFYLVSDGTDKPQRARIRTGSFSAMSIMEHLSPRLMIADLVALIASLDVVAPEVDR